MSYLHDRETFAGEHVRLQYMQIIPLKEHAINK